MTGLAQTEAAEALKEPVAPTPSPPPTPPVSAPEIADDDPDMVALKAAEAELEAEEKGEKPPGQAEPLAADKGALPPALPAEAAPEGTKPAKEPEPAEQITIPKARFDQVRERARDAQIAAIEAKAESKTLRDLLERGVIQPHQLPGGAPPAQAPAPTIPEQVSTLREQQRALATDFEGGRIGAAEWEKQRQDVDDKILELRLNERQAQPAQNEDLLLTERTDAIVVQYPILEHLTKAHLDPLGKIAVATMEFEGKTYNSNDPSSVLDLRQRIAKMADQAYEIEGVASPSRQTQAPATEPAQAPAAAPTASTPAPAQPGVTPEQRKAKLDLAAQQPPSLTSAPGSTTGGLDGLTEESFLAMSTEEVAQLPTEVLDRIAAQGLK